FRKSSSFSAMLFPSSASTEQAANHLCSVIDHGNDASVVESGGTEHSNDPHDLAISVGVGSRDDGRPREAEQPVLGPNEDVHAVTQARQLEELNEIVLALYVVEERPDTLEIDLRFDAI